MRSVGVRAALAVAAAAGCAGDGAGSAPMDVGAQVDTQAGGDSLGPQDAGLADGAGGSDGSGQDADGFQPQPSGGDPLVETARALPGDPISDLVVRGDVVLACTPSGVEARDATTLALTGALPLPAGCRRLADLGGAAAVITRAGGLVPLKVADGAVTQDGVAYEPGPTLLSAAQVGTSLVATAGAQGLVLVEGAAATPLWEVAGARDVAARGGLALVTAGGSLVVVRVEPGPVEGLAVLPLTDVYGEPSRSAWRVDASGPLVAVTGTHGVALVDLTDPSKPTQVGVIPLSGAPVSTTSLGPLLAVAAWGAVEAWDVSDPAAPARVGVEEVRLPPPALPVAHFATVRAHAGALVAAGPAAAIRLTVDAAKTGPDIALPNASVLFAGIEPGSQASGGFLLSNDGTEPLVIGSISIADPAFTVTIDPDFAGPVEDYDPRPAMVIGPGEKGFIDVAFDAATAVEVASTLTILSNDPDEGALVVPAVGNMRRLQAGDPAPDVMLPALDGSLRSLSDQKGKVVYVKVFSGL
ncbi:MAG: hypothetical protein AMXMBFR64_48610 [Myxococcales bacterium]